MRRAWRILWRSAGVVLALFVAWIGFWRARWGEPADGGAAFRATPGGRGRLRVVGWGDGDRVRVRPVGGAGEHRPRRDSAARVAQRDLARGEGVYARVTVACRAVLPEGEDWARTSGFGRYASAREKRAF